MTSNLTVRSDAVLASNSLTDRAELGSALEGLIRPSECVLSFDKSLVENFAEILKEQYGIYADGDEKRNADLSRMVRWFENRIGRSVRLHELPKLLMEENLDGPRYRPLMATDVTAKEFDRWSTATAGENLDSALALQKDLGRGAHNKEKSPYDPNERGGASLRTYLRDVTTVRPSVFERLVGLSFWQVKVKLWRMLGLIPANCESLSVGPRWNTEVLFFREVVGFQRHIGLDLSSVDPELIKVGDMHKMPLPSDTYSFIFIKNTCDKSYDIRKFVDELIRVVAPNGIIAIDQICGHGAVSPLHRTDIQKAGNLMKLFAARAKIKTLVCKDINIRKISRDGSANNARLAIQVVK